MTSFFLDRLPTYEVYIFLPTSRFQKFFLRHLFFTSRYTVYNVMYRGIGQWLHPTQLSYNPHFCVIDITTTTVDFNLLLVITSPSFRKLLDTPMTDKTITYFLFLIFSRKMVLVWPAAESVILEMS